MAKVLVIDYEKCTGCRICEQVCAVKHEGVVNPVRSRIKIIKWEQEGRYVPMVCQQCESAPCQSICPVKAISRDESLNRVMVDYDICIGCRMCVAICPFGGMAFDPLAQKVMKCDFCDGDPQCVRFCEVKAVDFVEADEVSILKKRNAAERLSAASKEAAALEAKL